MLTFKHDEKKNQYVAFEGDERVGLVDYDRDGSRVVLTHTETDPAHQGKGIAGGLMRHVLDDVRTRGWSVIPQCSYAANFIEKHPEYSDVLH